MAEQDKCTVREGRIVEPCSMLNEMAEFGNPPKGKARGIYEWRYTNLQTHKPSRAFFGAKSTNRPQGMAFNFCPWCGEKIDAPLLTVAAALSGGSPEPVSGSEGEEEGAAR